MPIASFRPWTGNGVWASQRVKPGVAHLLAGREEGLDRRRTRPVSAEHGRGLGALIATPHRCSVRAEVAVVVALAAVSRVLEAAPAA